MDAYDARGEVEAVRREMSELQERQARDSASRNAHFSMLTTLQDRLAVALMRLSNIELAVKTIDSRLEELLGLVKRLVAR